MYVWSWRQSTDLIDYRDVIKQLHKSSVVLLCWQNWRDAYNLLLNYNCSVRMYTYNFLRRTLGFLSRYASPGSSHGLSKAVGLVGCFARTKLKGVLLEDQCI